MTRITIYHIANPNKLDQWSMSSLSLCGLDLDRIKKEESWIFNSQTLNVEEKYLCKKCLENKGNLIFI